MRSKTGPGGQNRTFTETARRAQIMAAAIDTIAKLGYGQASLARIAEAAGTSKGVIIYHFGGKDALIRELLQELIARAGAYMRPRIEAEQTGAGMLRAFIETNLAFMAENRNHVAATVEIALNAHAADGSRLFGQRFTDAAVASVAEMLIYFQGTGEFRADFDPQVMAIAVRAAIDTVGTRFIRDPGLDLAHHARELASMFIRAARNEENPPAAHHPHQEES
ncbi:MAG TPA: TetR/AcrR family transcriptional regulator [Streptosporangiaceae bacterium]